MLAIVWQMYARCHAAQVCKKVFCRHVSMLDVGGQLPQYACLCIWPSIELAESVAMQV